MVQTQAKLYFFRQNIFMALDLNDYLEMKHYLYNTIISNYTLCLKFHPNLINILKIICNEVII